MKKGPFTFVNDFSKLSSAEKEEFMTAIEMFLLFRIPMKKLAFAGLLRLGAKGMVELIEGKELKFQGALHNKSLIGFLLSSPGKSMKERVVSFVWTAKCPESIEFKRKFGSSPAIHLLTDLVGKGVRSFLVGKTYPKGLSMASGLKKKGLLVDGKQGELTKFKVTDKWVKKANSLKRRLSIGKLDKFSPSRKRKLLTSKTISPKRFERYNKAKPPKPGTHRRTRLK